MGMTVQKKIEYFDVNRTITKLLLKRSDLK